MRAKPIISVFLLVCVCFFSCSCASNHSKSVHFIHAAAIIPDKSDSFKLLCVAEKQSGKDSDNKYLTISSSGKTVDEAAKALTEKYGGCYFASCELYFIPQSADMEFIHSIADICQSGVLPSHPYTLCADSNEIQRIFRLLDSEDKITSLISDSKKHSPAFVSFISKQLSKKAVKLPTVTVENNEKAGITQYSTFYGDGSKSMEKEKKQ